MTPVDPNGRVVKIGVDVHAKLCWDGHRLICVCGKERREQEAQVTA